MSDGEPRLRVLLIEDNEDDATLIVHELSRSGFDATAERVTTREEAIAAFGRGGFDIVLSDYHLPHLTAPEALALYRESGRDAPFLVCSGTIGEEDAVGLLKAGAADFFRKDVLARLGTAIRRELHDVEARRARHSAELRLGESEERFRLVVEASPNGILLTDSTGLIILVNSQVERMFGFERADLLNRPVEMLVPEGVRAGHASHRAGFAENPIARRMGGGRELYGRRRDGGTFPVEIGLSHFQAAGGPMILATIVDVTRRQTMELQLRQAQKMEAVGRLAAGIAHDFNNILTAIAGFGELARADLAADHPIQEWLDEILGAAGRASGLVRQMLAFSRRQVLRPRAVALNDVINACRAMLGQIIREDIELVLRLEPRLRTVLADPTQMEQILVNLVANARDAMSKGGTITIETANVDFDEEYVRRHPAGQPGPYVMLSVSDTGAGMDETTRAHVFEPFFTTKPEGKGVGLGLATVYGIVKQSDGFVWVYSEPGHGAIIKTYLPGIDRPAEALDLPEAQREIQRSSGRILVVEDQDGVRRMTQECLERQGYSVLSATDGVSALEILAKEADQIDLLLTDVIMPGMNGPELAARLRVQRPGLRVLFMSGYTKGTMNDRGLLGNDTRLLEKPFSATELLAAVQKALGQAEPRSGLRDQAGEAIPFP